MFCRVEGGRTEGPPELLIFRNDEVEWETIGEWNGLGMRGNCSVPMIFNGVVPEENVVGIELEDKSMPVMTKYMAPCQILTYGAAYLGIASGAFEIACTEGAKRYPSGARRLDSPINQRRMAEMSAQIEAARALLHSAAAMGDSGQATSVLQLGTENSKCRSILHLDLISFCLRALNRFLADCSGTASVNRTGCRSTWLALFRQFPAT
jgi:alkylation response protein AidB-like acyl-CoA dehydrogenase